MTLRPSDNLNINYKALKPGNYKPGEDLTQYTKEHLVFNNKFKTEVPLGVGDVNSMVYIHVQGTIEVIGKVYAWNKLVKPGIYSAWEKLRYIGEKEETIPTRDTESHYNHHAGYNYNFTTTNRYVNVEGRDRRIRYVSFEDQITNGIIPVPILDGKLTIYPDGTFKTEGLVVSSTLEARLVDDYGYIGDSKNYQNHDTDFRIQGVSKEELKEGLDLTLGDPRVRLYQIISNNEDGSITYGPIEENKKENYPILPKPPEGIIPINDGTFTVNALGDVSITGTVITCYGHRITSDKFNYTELFTRENGKLIENERLVDKNNFWCFKNEVHVSFGGTNTYSSGFALTSSVPYMYVPDKDCYYILETKLPDSEKHHIQFRPMKGWDNFKPIDVNTITGDEIRSPFYTLINVFRNEILNKSLKEMSLRDHTYPILLTEPLDLYGSYKNLEYRWVPGHYYKDGEGRYDNVVVLDWSFFNDVFTPVSPCINKSINKSTKVLNNKPYTEWSKLVRDNFTVLGTEIVENIKDVPLQQMLVPYLTEYLNEWKGEENYIEIIDGNLTVKGNCIYKRGDRYYTLYEGTCKLDTTWPDVVEDNGEFKNLISLDGYWKDEPIFIRKKDDTSYSTTLLDVRRQEEGLFSLIKRDVTEYLTKYEKILIDNIMGVGSLTVITESDKNIEQDTLFRVYPTLPVGKKFTTEDTKLVLQYHAVRFNEFFPSYLNGRLTSEIGSYTNFNRYLYYDRFKDYYYSYNKKNYNWLVGNDFNILQTLEPYQITNKLSKTVLASIHSSVKTNTLNNYNKLFNDRLLISFNDYCKGYWVEPVLTCPEEVLKDKGKVTVTVDSRNPVLIYWKTDETKMLYPNSKEIEGRVSFDIDFTDLIKEQGTIEVWYNDPFEERSNLKTIKVINKDDITPISLVDKHLDNNSRVVTGRGHPNSLIRMTDKYGKLLGKTETDNIGRWSIRFGEDLDAYLGEPIIFKQIAIKTHVTEVTIQSERNLPEVKIYDDELPD